MNAMLSLLRYTRSILETYFGDEQLAFLIGDWKFGCFARTILEDGKYARGVRRKQMLAIYALRTDPVQFMRIIVGHICHIPLSMESGAALRADCL